MQQQQIANAAIDINAPIERVWDALVNPIVISQYMAGATVTSDWRPGSSIAWRGEWKGRTFEDHGEILQVVPKQRLEYTHYSPLSGEPDEPQSYHHVSIELTRHNGTVHLELSQDNNHTDEARRHSENNWKQMLSTMKDLLEKSG